MVTNCEFDVNGHDAAGVVTFVRFFPQLKARYDYGLLIFMLTFCLVSISGYREDEILEMAHQRISTILIGSSTSVFICLFVFPVWAGDDLHNLVASNLEKLGSFLEGMFIVNWCIKWKIMHVIIICVVIPFALW